MQENTIQSTHHDPLLKLPAVEAMVLLRRSSIYAMVKRGEFPAPIKLSRRLVCWPSSLVEAWISGRIEESMAQNERQVSKPV